MTDYSQRLSDLRDRAHRIFVAARDDPDVPRWRVEELRTGLQLIELGWETIEDHPNPEAAAPFDLAAKVEEWEAAFDEQEEKLGIA